MEADLILYNGRIHSVARQNPNLTAVAIKGGKFVAVGSDADIMKWAVNGTTKIDPIPILPDWSPANIYNGYNGGERNKKNISGYLKICGEKYAASKSVEQIGRRV